MYLILCIAVTILVLITIVRGILKTLIIQNGGRCSSENLSHKRIKYLKTISDDKKELSFLNAILFLNKINSIVFRVFLFLIVVYLIFKRD